MDRAPLRRPGAAKVPRVGRARDGAWLEAALVAWPGAALVGLAVIAVRSGVPLESRRLSRSSPRTALDLGHVLRLSLTSVSTR